MNDWILIGLFIIIFGLLAYCIKNITIADFTHYLHMFQLNSYFPTRFAGWKKKTGYVFGQASFGINILFFFAFAAAFYFSPQNFLLVFAVWMSLLFSTRKKVMKPVKKPLVYTARIKRMIGVYLGLFGLCIAGLSLVLVNYFDIWYSMLYATMFTMYLFTVVNYYLVYLINLMLRPFEKYLGNRFYNEAKQIIGQNKDLIKIGITGSYGKTSTKFILENILKMKYVTLVTPHSYNTTLGVVRTIREHFTGGVEAFVAEMGAKQRGDIKEICDLVKPELAVITSVGPQHLETFGSLDNVIATKFELAEAVGKRGTVIVNYDDDNIKEGMKRYPDVNYLTYGQDEKSDVRIGDIKVSEQGSSFTVTYQGKTHSYQTGLLGMHNISNLAAGIALGLHLGIAPEKIAMGIRETRPVEHRLELKMKNGYYILDDAFNSNPVGANNALEVLKAFPNGKKIVMTPGMVELGSADEEVHFTFGKHMAECVDTAILVGEQKTAKIKEGLLAGGFAKDRIHVVKDVYEGFAVSKQHLNSGDILLIENDLPDNY